MAENKEKVKKEENETDVEQDRSISWRAAEYEHFEKGGGWYLMVGFATLLLLIIALWQKNFFFGIFILLAGIMVVILGNRRPDVLDFKLTKDGCEVGRGVFYAYGSLENFSLRSRVGRLDELILKKKTAFNPYVKISLDNQTAEKVRIFLIQKLPEVEHKGSLLDIFIDFLGF